MAAICAEALSETPVFQQGHRGTEQDALGVFRELACRIVRNRVKASAVRRRSLQSLLHDISRRHCSSIAFHTGLPKETCAIAPTTTWLPYVQ